MEGDWACFFGLFEFNGIFEYSRQFLTIFWKVLVHLGIWREKLLLITWTADSSFLAHSFRVPDFHDAAKTSTNKRLKFGHDAVCHNADISTRIIENLFGHVRKCSKARDHLWSFIGELISRHSCFPTQMKIPLGPVVIKLFARGTLKSPNFFGGTPKYVKMVK